MKRMVATFDVPDDYDKHDIADLLPGAFREHHALDPTVWEWSEFWADARDGIVGPGGDTTAEQTSPHAGPCCGEHDEVCDAGECRICPDPDSQAALTAAHPLPDGTVRVYEPTEHDIGRMYVLDVFGISVLIRERDGDFYVHVDKDGESAPRPTLDTKALAVEVNNAGEVVYE